MHVRRLLQASVAIAALVTLLATPAAAQVSEFTFIPRVISANGPAQTLLTVTAPAPATRAVLNTSLFGTPNVELRDDGLAGDAVAGDHVFTASLSTATMLAAVRPQDGYYLFLGLLDVFNGTTRLLRMNAVATIYTPALGSWPGVSFSPTVRASTRVVNIVDPGASPSGSLTGVTTEFYRWFPDNYDFLNIVFAPTRLLNRSHVAVRNDVTGTGQPVFNGAAGYGSGGRLLGLNLFPILSLFDGASAGYIHELGHQWINYLTLPLLTNAGRHWPYSSMGTGVMGISIPPSGQGGAFPCTVTEQNGQVLLTPRPDGPFYNDLEMYLLGLLPAAQVRPQVVFDDQIAASALVCQGQTYTGAVTHVTVQDVIAAMGPRVPATAPSSWRIATIYVTPTPATADEMSLVSYLADRAELRTPVYVPAEFQTQMPFYVATGGRATLDTHLDLPTPGAPTGLTASVAGNTVSLSWSAPAGGVAPTSYVLDAGVTPGGVVASLPLAGTATSFSVAAPSGVFYLRVAALAGPQRGPSSNEVPVFVNVPVPPSAPRNLLGTVNGSALTLAWQHTSSGGTPTGAILDVSGTLSASLPLGPGELFQFPSVPPGAFTFTVRATNASGTSAPSNAVNLTFPGGCSGAPTAPAGFAASVSGQTIAVRWDLPASGPAPDSFALTVSGAFNGVLPLSGRSVSGTVPPGAYTLRVAGVNGCGTGVATAPQTVIVP